MRFNVKQSARCNTQLATMRDLDGTHSPLMSSARNRSPHRVRKCYATLQPSNKCATIIESFPLGERKRASERKRRHDNVSPSGSCPLESQPPPSEPIVPVQTPSFPPQWLPNLSVIDGDHLAASDQLVAMRLMISISGRASTKSSARRGSLARASTPV